MSRWKNVYEAYWWVYDHPELDGMNHSPEIWITPHLVNPELLTDGHPTVDDNPANNTAVELWVECGTYEFSEDMGWHVCLDYDLECGGWTWEEAVYALAEKVLAKYGDWK